MYKIRDRLIILPDDNFKIRWEIYITLLLLFTALYTPYRLAFINNDTPLSTAVDIFTDVSFTFDVVLNFFMAY